MFRRDDEAEVMSVLLGTVLKFLDLLLRQVILDAERAPLLAVLIDPIPLDVIHVVGKLGAPPPTAVSNDARLDDDSLRIGPRRVSRSGHSITAPPRSRLTSPRASLGEQDRDGSRKAGPTATAIAVAPAANLWPKRTLPRWETNPCSAVSGLGCDLHRTPARVCEPG